MAWAGTEVGGVEVAKRVGRLASSAPMVMGGGLLVGAGFDALEDDCCVCCLSVMVGGVYMYMYVYACMEGGRGREKKRKRLEIFIF